MSACGPDAKPGLAISAMRVLRCAAVLVAALASLVQAQAQTPAPPQVGVILQGGPWYAMVEGLRAGLRDLDLKEGKDYVLSIRDTGGDLNAVGDAARVFERDKAALIFTAATSVSLAAKKATVSTPVVFAAGTDPVVVGLVQSIRAPGGRITGVQFSTGEVSGKRLELLRDMVPKLARVVTFYNPQNASSIESAKEGREAARVLGIDFLERHVSTPDELEAALEAFRPGDADAYVAVADALVESRSDLVVEMARVKHLPTLFTQERITERGGLASYGASYPDVGRLSAKYVQRILSGADPAELPVERVTGLVRGKLDHRPADWALRPGSGALPC